MSPEGKQALLDVIAAGKGFREAEEGRQKG